MGSDEMERRLACGHPTELIERSVESDYAFCQLCEARHRTRDAETMEARYKTERDTLRAQLAEAQGQAQDNKEAWIKEKALRLLSEGDLRAHDAAVAEEAVKADREHCARWFDSRADNYMARENVVNILRALPRKPLRREEG